MWLEMNDVEKGIVQVIREQNIRWLVMGAAAEKYYSKYMPPSIFLMICVS